MVTTWSKGLALLALAIMVSGGLLASAADAKAGKPVVGTIKSVDTEKSSIVVMMGKKQEKTFDVAADAKIKVDGKKATLADLKPDMKASLTITDGKVTAIEVKAAKKKKKE